MFRDAGGVPGDVEQGARAALSARAVLAATEASRRGNRRRALSALALGARATPGLIAQAQMWALAGSVVRGHELGTFQHSKRLLGALYEDVRPSRFADRIRKVATTDASWERMTRRTAETIAHATSPAARVAVVDKHDPTILGLSERSGWHFPEHSLLPEGYPSDSAQAIAHLDALRARGATHLVFPSAAYWWLDHYEGLRRHLDESCAVVVRDDDCVIYALPADRAGAPAEVAAHV